MRPDGGDEQAAERQGQQQEAEHGDDDQEQRQLAGQRVGDVDVGRGGPADVDVQAGSGLGPRDDVRAQRADQVAGRLVLRGGGRDDLDGGQGAAGTAAGAVTEATSCTVGQLAGEGGQCRPGLGVRGLGDEQQRGVEALAERAAPWCRSSCGHWSRRGRCWRPLRRAAGTAPGRPGRPAPRRPRSPAATAGVRPPAPTGPRLPGGQARCREPRLVPASAGDPAAARSDRRSTRRPIMASSAGSRVTAAMTVRNTVTAAPMPSPLTKPTLRMSRPSSATMTVPPAKSTARPEVFIAVAIALVQVGALPQRLAVPVDDEQRVVDADAEPDQGAQLGGDAGQRDDVREQDDREAGDADAGDPGDDRQHRRPDRPEDQEQDQQGGEDADDLADPSGADLGEGGAAHLDVQLAAWRLPWRVSAPAASWLSEVKTTVA